MGNIRQDGRNSIQCSMMPCMQHRSNVFDGGNINHIADILIWDKVYIIKYTFGNFFKRMCMLFFVHLIYKAAWTGQMWTKGDGHAKILVWTDIVR